MKCQKCKRENVLVVCITHHPEPKVYLCFSCSIKFIEILSIWKDFGVHEEVKYWIDTYHT